MTISYACFNVNGEKELTSILAAECLRMSVGDQVIMAAHPRTTLLMIKEFWDEITSMLCRTGRVFKSCSRPLIANAADQDVGGQQPAHLETQITVSMDYLLYLPEDYAKEDSWPLLLFLHGSGERGDDLDLVTIHGPPKLIKEGKKFPFIVVSPQCPTDHRWQAVTLSALLDEIDKNYKVDEDRIYVTGLSMGGFGTWSLAAYTPHRFAAIMPICGGGETVWTKQFPHLPVWVFHGAMDKAVPLRRSEELVASLKKRGGNPKFTIYPDAEHDSWTETYANPKVYEWLLQQKRVATE